MHATWSSVDSELSDDSSVVQGALAAAARLPVLQPVSGFNISQQQKQFSAKIDEISAIHADDSVLARDNELAHTAELADSKALLTSEAPASSGPLVASLVYDMYSERVLLELFICEPSSTAQDGGDSPSSPHPTLRPIEVPRDHKANCSFYSPNSTLGPSCQWPQSCFYPLSPSNDTGKSNLLDTTTADQPRPGASPHSDSPALPRTPSPTANPSSPMWTSTTASSPTSSMSTSQFKSSSSASSEDVFSDPDGPSSDDVLFAAKAPSSYEQAAEQPETAHSLQAWVNDSTAQEHDAVAAIHMRRKKVSFATLPDIEEQAAAEAPVAAAPTPTPSIPAAAPRTLSPAPAPKTPELTTKLDSISARFAAVTANLNTPTFGKASTRASRALPPTAPVVPAPQTSRRASPPRQGPVLTASPLLVAQTTSELPPTAVLAAPYPLATDTTVPAAAAAPEPEPVVAELAIAPAALDRTSASPKAPLVAAPVDTPAAATIAGEEAGTDAPAEASAESSASSARTLSASAVTASAVAVSALTAAALTAPAQAEAEQPPSPDSLAADAPAPVELDAPALDRGSTSAALERGSMSLAPRERALPSRAAAQAQFLTPAAAAAAFAPAGARAAAPAMEGDEESKRDTSFSVEQLEWQSIRTNGYEPAKGFWSLWMWNRTANVKRKPGYLNSPLGIEKAIVEQKQAAAAAAAAAASEHSATGRRAASVARNARDKADKAAAKQ